MKRLFIIGWITLFINSYLLQAQQQQTVDKWMEYVEELASQTDNSEQVETLYNDLSYLTEHPFNLNTVTAEQLQKLPFLSDEHIAALLAYRRKYGEMASIYELKGIKEINSLLIELLLPFVYVEPVINNQRALTIKNILKYGKNELAVRFDRCLQTKKGYQQVSDSLLTASPNKYYLGEPFYNSLRYSFTFEETIQAGIVTEKDAGEPFLRASHKGYDYYSAHLLLRNIGRLKTLALGDYKASFGQGLVLSHDFTPGRSVMVTRAERRNNGFRRHYSTNETDFFRGVAATANFNKIDISLFYSRRKLDGRVEGEEIRSFKTDGLHRLVKDLEKTRTVSMQTTGGNVRYASPNVCIGLTAVHYSFVDKVVNPVEKPYNLFYFRGKENVNIGVDYLLKAKRVKFFGETAVSKNGAVASLNALQVSPASYVSFLLLARSYSRRYQAYFANAFAQNSSVQNEQGVYAGLELTPFAQWKVAAYVDWFRFPWLKYGVNHPSGGKEYMVQVDYSGKKEWNAYLRYKYRDKEVNRQHRLRFQLSYLPGERWQLKTSADGVIYSLPDEAASTGWMLSQSVGYRPLTCPVQADLYIAFFHTDDYWSRISSYEKNLLYAFSMPSCYGRGVRLAVSFKAEVVKNLGISVKVACTDYFDREVISSGPEEITGHVKTDIYGLLRWKF